MEMLHERAPTGRARVGVIGAGAAGLVAARYFRDAGFEVEVWEMADEVGGTWLYSEAVVEGRGNLYRSLSTNLPKEIMQFSDLPFEGDLPSFVQHTEVERYLKQYADEFDLRPLIKFNTVVTLVERLPPETSSASMSSGRLWAVSYRQRLSRSATDAQPSATTTVTDRFDIVLVCNGHFSKIYAPLLDGLGSFPGIVMHSQEYREPSTFFGKTVVVIGSGASGVDITREVATKARRVYATVRGKPQPPPSPAIGNAPASGKNAVADVFGNSPALVVKAGCEIRRLMPNGYVEFSDDTYSDGPVDAVIFCTGYRYYFPFLAPSCRVFLHPTHALQALAQETGDKAPDQVELEECGMSVWPLFQHVLHVEHPSLAFIGLNWKVLPFACFETQVRFALAIMRHPQFLAWDADPALERAIDLIPPHEEASRETHTCSFPSTKREMINRLWAAWRTETKGSTPDMQRRQLREYHMLGSQQWSYYTHLQRLARQLDESVLTLEQGSPTANVHEDSAVTRDWKRIREIYEDVGQARLHSPDSYRSLQYALSPSDPKGWTVQSNTHAL